MPHASIPALMRQRQEDLQGRADLATIVKPYLKSKNTKGISVLTLLLCSREVGSSCKFWKVLRFDWISGYQSPGLWLEGPHWLHGGAESTTMTRCLAGRSLEKEGNPHPEA